MSRQFEPDDPEDPPPPDPSGHIRTTGAGPLVVFGLIGLVLGWLIRRVFTPAPTVGWLPVLALFFVALIVGSVAWSTYRAFHKNHERIEPHRAVNRLVLAKSCALAGAMVTGGYLGYALSWLGAQSELGRERILHSLLAALAGALIVVGSLLLERACRVRREDDRDLR